MEEAVTGRASEDAETADWLRRPGACFVTLTVNDRLRGCIGTLTPYRSLLDDVSGNARAAAVDDSRFPPVRPEDLAAITVEVSLVSPLDELHFSSESELLAQVRVGTDGLVIEHEAHRATFLPQVWENLGVPETFLSELRAKAGLSRSYWSDDLRAWRFTVDKLVER